MSKIEWTDQTWNPVTGCEMVSSGCTRCYAMRMARRHDGRGIGYDGTTRSTQQGPQWSGKVNLLPERLQEPLRWRKPRRVFVCSMSDLFHPDVPDEFIHAVFAVMALTPAHTYQVLTKRPERMAVMLNEPGIAGAVAGETFDEERRWPMIRPDDLAAWWPLDNVWLGTSVEDQPRADERIPHLLRCPAAVRFLSVEPMLGPVDLTCVAPVDDFHIDALDTPDPSFAVHWVIVGGESGPGARPMDIAWARSIVEQCRDARVACFVKQLGAFPVYEREFGTAKGGCPVPLRLRDSKGGDPSEWPADLSVREFPSCTEPTR